MLVCIFDKANETKSKKKSAEKKYSYSENIYAAVSRQWNMGKSNFNTTHIAGESES